MNRYELIGFDYDDDFALEELGLDIYEVEEDALEIAKNGGVSILSDKVLRSVLVDTKEKKVIGALWVSEGGSDFSFDIAIDSSYQNMGLSSKLIESAISEYEYQKEAYGDNFKMNVDVINPKLAQILEKKYGFHVTGHLGPNRVLMSLKESYEKQIIRKEVAYLIRKSFPDKTDLLFEHKVAVKKITKDFDHLKWPLNKQQKYFLSDFIENDPNCLKESDYEYMSQITGIPAKNLKSIINTYGKVKFNGNQLNDYKTRFEYGNKPYYGTDFDFEPKYKDSLPKFKKVDSKGYYITSKGVKNIKDFTPTAEKAWQKRNALRGAMNNVDYYYINKNIPKKQIPDNLIAHSYRGDKNVVFTPYHQGVSPIGSFLGKSDLTSWKEKIFSMLDEIMKED